MPPKKNNKKKEPISKAEEEEMSSALIARLLAEDAMQSGASSDDYYAEYSNDAGAYEQYHARGGEDYNDGNYEDDSEDDNYAPKKKSSRAKSKASPGPGKRGRKRKASEPEETESTSATNTDTTTTTTENEGNESTTTTTTTKTENHSSTTTTPVKKPKKPVPEGCNTGVYSEEEESKFLEGLRLFGRDWPKLAAHIKTRDSNSIRSHAQKHFIKMYRDNIPLPDKVRESGEGYTLSGKPLDPNSAAARAYLARSSVNQNKSKATTKATTDSTTSDATTNNDNNNDKIQPASSQSQSEQVSKSTEQQDRSSEQSPTSTSTTTTTTITSTSSTSGTTDSSNTSITTSTEDPTSTLSNLAIGEQHNNSNNKPKSPPPPTNPTEQKRKTSPKTKQTKPSRSATPEQQQRNNTSAYDENGRTSYSKLRLRRTRERPSIMYNQLNKDDDPLTMIKCEPFNGKPGSNISGCQPFELQVHSNVLLQMDFHAHLMTTEIIGFLAGEWDKVQKKMCIKEAFPCRSLNTGQNDVNVEMDPTSAIETRQLIEEKNMTVVGWYHSHPTFIPDPSIVDLENQRNYQILCREECHHDHGDDDDDAGTGDDPMVIDGQEEQVRSGGGTTGTIEPFVGAIVGPYDPRLPGSASVINWFYVGDSKDDRKIPKRLIYELQNDQSLSSENADRLFDLLNVYKDSPEKVDFTDLWRQDSHESKLEKIIKSLGVRMPWIERPNNNNDKGDDEDENMDERDQENQKEKEKSTSVIDSFLTRVRDSLKDW